MNTHEFWNLIFGKHVQQSRGMRELKYVQCPHCPLFPFRCASIYLSDEHSLNCGLCMGLNLKIVASEIPIIAVNTCCLEALERAADSH